MEKAIVLYVLPSNTQQKTRLVSSESIDGPGRALGGGDKTHEVKEL